MIFWQLAYRPITGSLDGCPTSVIRIFFALIREWNWVRSLISTNCRANP